MKIDQVAYYAASDEQANQIKAQLGLTEAEWIRDIVTANSNINGGAPAINVAQLQFNYSLGIELELIRYIKGPHWHVYNPLATKQLLVNSTWQSFLSHVGIHLEDNEDFPAMEHCKLVQETFTISHTSDYLTNPSSKGFGRKYHYRIFELSPGSYIKYIRRLNP